MNPRNVFKRSLLLAAIVASAAVLGGFEFVNDTTPVPTQGTLGAPLPGLSSTELATWIRGRRIFDHDFHLNEGLGRPEMNGDSCRACHNDGAIGGGGPIDLNVSRFANDNGGMGPYTELPGGQIAARFRRPDTLGREEIPTNADVFEQRNSPPLFGFGLIESIPAAAILANEDPNDVNGDGVRGVARMVPVGGGQMEVGRFGWKAQIPTVSDFVHDAMGEELGVTTILDGRGFGIGTDNDGVADPELSAQDFNDVTFFIRNLAPPPRGGATTPLVTDGEMLFDQIGCTKCHKPSLPGAAGPVNLYSDLLIHNVHPVTFRGMQEAGAPVGSYRTPPLWGLSKSGPYLHDGSAASVRDAILRHDGEALMVRLDFAALTSEDQVAILAFLNDL